MANRMYRNWLTSLLAVAFFLQFLPGCGGGDLKGYRPAREHSAETVANQTQVSPTENDAVASEPSDVKEKMAIKSETSANDSEFLPVSAVVPVNMVDGGNVRALMSIPASDAGIGSRAGRADAAVEGHQNVIGASESRKIELLVKEKAFRTEPKTGAIRLSFDDLDLLKILNMDPVVENAVALMPDWLRAIDGKTVRLRGFMYPTYDAEGIEHFVLARDNQICCFGRDPKIYDLVQIDMKQGKSTSYIPPTRAFDVVGKFKIEMQSQEGKPYGLYSIEQADVIDR